MSIPFAITKAAASCEYASNAQARNDESKKTSVEKPQGKDPTEVRKAFAAKEIDAVASDVQKYLKRINTELRIEIDKDSEDIIVKIVDSESGKIIREVPPEDFRDIRDRMQQLVGVLYKSKT